MEMVTKKLFIPRKKAEGEKCRVEAMPQKRDVPVEDILVRMMARIYQGRGHSKNESA